MGLIIVGEYYSAYSMEKGEKSTICNSIQLYAKLVIIGRVNSPGL
jgi:hypothetical protein